MLESRTIGACMLLGDISHLIGRDNTVGIGDKYEALSRYRLAGPVLPFIVPKANSLLGPRATPDLPSQRAYHYQLVPRCRVVQNTSPQHGAHDSLANMNRPGDSKLSQASSGPKDVVKMIDLGVGTRFPAM